MADVLIRSYSSEAQLRRILSAFPKTAMLFATTGLRRGFLDPKRNWSRVTGPDFIFKELLKEMYPDWSAAKRRLAWHAQLGPILRRAFKEASESDATKGDVPAWKALVNGRQSVLSAIELLVLSGIAPDDIDEVKLSDAERVFRKAWSLFENAPHAAQSSPAYFRQHFYDSTSDHCVDASVTKLAGDCASAKRIFVAGFYFISPIQYQVFEALRKRGWSLIFLNYYDPERPSAFKVWHKTFGSRAFPILNVEWKTTDEDDPVGPKPLALRLHSALTGGQTSSLSGKHSLYEYPTPVDMLGAYLQDCHSANSEEPDSDDRYWFTRDRDTLRNLVSSLDPNGLKDLPRLACTPAGQFLVTLHDCWREDKTTQNFESAFVLSRERFRALLMSGFLNASDNGRRIEGARLVPALNRLFDFLRGVDEHSEDGRVRLPEGAQVFDNWTARLREAKTAAEASLSFEADVERALRPAGGKKRFHRYLGNPYRYLSFVRVKPEAIADLMILINVVRSEFGAALLHSDFDASAHLEAIIGYLKREAPVSPDDYDRAVFQNLMSSIKDSAVSVANVKFEPDECASAVRLILGEPLEHDDPDSPEGRISALEDLDRLHGFAPLSIHIADLSARWIPTAASPVPWPLTNSFLENVKVRSAERAKRLVTQLEAKAEADLFLFYGALAISPDVILSWAHQLNGDESVASPFLRLLDLDVTPLQISSPAPARSDALTFARASVALTAADFPIEAALIYSMCPRRYVYDFVVHEGPFYETGFTQQFAISNYLHLRALVDVLGGKPNPWRAVGSGGALAVEEVIEAYRVNYTGYGNHPVWSKAALRRAISAAQTVSKGSLQYPDWFADDAAARPLYPRAFLRLLLLPSQHDEAWTSWRERVGYEAMVSDYEAALLKAPDSTASDQRMGEFLNTYWSPPHRHLNGAKDALFGANPRLPPYLRDKEIRKSANEHQSRQVLKRRQAFRSTGVKPDESVPEARPGNWCKMCPHAGHCAAVKRDGEAGGES